MIAVFYNNGQINRLAKERSGFAVRCICLVRRSMLFQSNLLLKCIIDASY